MNVRPCLVCQNEAELFCLRCHEPYCSNKCQEFDWSNNHKTICIAMPSLVTAANFGTARPPNPLLMDILTARRLDRIAPRPHKKTDGVMPAKPSNQNNNNLNYPLKTENKAKTLPSIKVEVKNNNSANASKLRGSTSNSAEIRQATISKLVEVKLPLKPHELKASNSPENKQKKIPEPTEIERPQKPLEMEAASIILVKGEVAFATMDDLETVPIPVGTKKKLYCSDFSNIKKGYVTACVYDAKAIARIEVMGVKISEHCARSKDSYNPQLNELCFALYEDGEWYRAMVAKVIDSNTFEIVFIDYGNMVTVKNSDIRKMTEHFLQRCFMNKCYVTGAPEKPTDEDVNKMVLFFTENQKFSIELATKLDDGYMISVPELQW